MASRRDGRRRRELLLDAALRVFAERGVFGAGIEEVRRAAGASPSSVYHLFEGKGDLVSALLERTFERLFAHLAESLSNARTAEVAVKRLVSAHLEWVLAHPDEGRFMYQATSIELDPKSAKRLRERKAILLAPVVERLSPFLEDGSLPKWPPATFDVVLLGPSHEACRRLLAGADFDVRWMKRTLPELAWKSVSGARASARANARSATPSRRRRRAGR